MDSKPNTTSGLQRDFINYFGTDGQRHIHSIRCLKLSSGMPSTLTLAIKSGVQP